MIDVTCAIIRNEEDDILIVQRGEATDHPFKWEFPGGKLMRGESPEDCVIREVKEELSIDIVIIKRLADVEYDYGIKKIKLIPFVCDTLEDVPFLSEHIAYRWVTAIDFTGIDFSEADVIVADNYAKIIGFKKQVVEETDNDVELNEREICDFINKMKSSNEAEWMAASVNENRRLLKKLIELSYSDDQKLASHSSWILSKAYEKNPDLIDSDLNSIIESLPSVHNESVMRSLLKIYSLSDPAKLNSKSQGLLADICFKHLNSGLSSIGVKAYSMEILYNLTLIYPDLSTELALSLRNVADVDSAGIQSKVRSILKRLDKT
ncbi:MAG TPA: (deoxy)nucleoside triphosphate pyrophosphohydrolase [Bacteroidales bacterium]|nr:(deoxy)nucleoside triphosphate pyrophosphohydrolase [Bacteroidales bacterium]